jgi:hypothetical protein
MIYIKDLEDGTLMIPEEFKLNVETVPENKFEVIILVNRDAVLENAQEVTALRARFAKREDGTPLLDVFAIMADDEAICNKWINEGGMEVFSKLSGWSKKIVDAYCPNVAVDTTGGTPVIEPEDGGDYMKFSYELNPKQDINMWESIEKNIEGALSQKVIYEWMRLNRYMDDYVIEKEKGDTLLESARSCMIRNAKPYRRPLLPL